MDPNALIGMYGSLGAGEAVAHDLGAGGYDDWWDDDEAFRQGVFHNLGNDAESPNVVKLDVGAVDENEYTLDPREQQYVRQTQSTLTPTEKAAWDSAVDRGASQSDVADAINELRTRESIQQAQQGQSNGRKALVVAGVVAVIGLGIWFTARRRN